MPLMSHLKQCTPLALALATSLPTHAYELYNQNGSILNADLEAMLAVMHSDKNYTVFGNREAGSSNWHEGYIKYGLSGSQELGGNGSLYGAFNLLSSGTWGEPLCYAWVAKRVGGVT
ncbi:hypothetical protein D3C84_904860 [compost metagenome]